MAILAIVLSSLALLAAVSAVVLTLSNNHKRDQEWKAEADRLRKDVTDLKGGVVPDYEKAKEAAKAVNDFNAGVSGILGFDPYEAIRKTRAENGGGEAG